MRILSTIRKKLLWGKQYLSRTMGYIGLINSSMILFLFLGYLQDRGLIEFELSKYFFPIVLLGVIMLIVLGWIDVNILRGMQEEMRISFQLNPCFTEMNQKLSNIEKEIKEIKEKQNE